jgi:LuxR family transcriptional regulator, quorum-sensing system regulator SolR
MAKISISQEHPMFRQAKNIDSIFSPLCQLHFCCMCYIRIYNDGTFLDLSNNSEMLSYFMLDLDGYRYINYQKVFDRPNGYEISLSSGDFGQAVQEVRKKCNLHHNLCLFNKHPSYQEIWQFTAEKDDCNIYLKNLDLLKKFTFHFREKAKPIINQAENHKLKVCGNLQTKSTFYNNMNLQQNLENEFTDNLDIKRYYLGEKFNNTYLTKREVDCLFWLAQGKSACEIAMILETSKRTIDSHIDNCKTKLQCYKQSQLVKICIYLGII